MIDFLRWLIVLEVLGLACLPLTVWMFRWLPDRGYIFSKILGLVIVTYLTWVIGTVLPLAASPLIPLLALVALGAAGWWLWRGETTAMLAATYRLVLLEEGLFVAALIVWTILRVSVFDPSIAHTEQFMDMTFLNGSVRSASYPPYDPWMSGHSINYYYLGYLMAAMLIKLSGVAPTVGYNLALSTLFAGTLSGTYALGYALTRRYAWAALSPLFVALLGNWHAILWQLPHAPCPGSASPGFWGWFWDSTRVIGGHFTLNDWACSQAVGPRDYTTINEFPLFSFVLGDLHPHLMALPVALLVLALGCDMLFSRERPAGEISVPDAGRLIVCAICVGALFTINSWDFPTYLLVVIACVGAYAYITDSSRDWWKRPLLPLCALTFASLALYLPFYMHFRSLAHGIGLVSIRSDLYEYVQVFGFPLLTCAALVGTLAFLLRPVEEQEDVAVEEDRSQPAVGELGQAAASRLGADTLLLLGLLATIAVIGGVLHAWVLLLDVALGVWSLLVLHRVLNTEEPNLGDAAALIFVAVACGVLALTELIYVRDAFDEGTMYRMNTVFKFYYQAWLLLGLAGSYGAYRCWEILRRHFRPAYARILLGVVALGAAGGAVYTRYLPSYAVAYYGVSSLDGMAWMQKEHSSDLAAIRWLLGHAPSGAVELEAVGDDYQYGARVSTFTGLPTVMGWVGHEAQWRPGNAEVAARAHDVRTIYTSSSQARAIRLLREYKVRYVVVGDQERTSYGAGRLGMTDFARFMRVAFRSAGTTVYTW